MAGTMQATNIIALLTALDGSEEDLDKVLAIEARTIKHRQTNENGGDDE